MERGLIVRVPEETHRKLKLLSLLDDRSMQKIVLEMIEEKVKDRPELNR